MRVVLIVAAMLTAMLALAAPASAHVTVSAPGATSGGSDEVITFRVPTESDTASTTGLWVQLPVDAPIAGVLVRPIPGWTHTQQTVKLDLAAVRAPVAKTPASDSQTGAVILAGIAVAVSVAAGALAFVRRRVSP